ncbi:hypothetical protein G6653_08655 [Polynucleobacter paneuropaeus]|nr:hypothetical protein [Polynucleobacter paneuropaeus]MBT8612032.1 hypothetical protein [Polynucleobacter paneuropaeus]
MSSRNQMPGGSALIVLAYVFFINPIILLIQSGGFAVNSARVTLTGTGLGDGLIINKIFWILLASYQLYQLRYHRTIFKINNIKNLAPIIILVGLEFLSTLWSYESEVTLRRSVQQLFLFICLCSPFFLKVDINKLLLWIGYLFFFIVVVNLLLIPISGISDFGYSGYFTHKNSLGQVSVLATYFLFFMVFQCKAKWERYFWLLASMGALALCLLSNSKTSIALLLVCPLFAIQSLRISHLPDPLSKMIWLNFFTIIIFLILACFYFNFYSIYDVSDLLYGDGTFTGRTKIWSFVEPYMENNIILGSGYGAFWNLGSSSASIGFGFIEGIIQAHNGYLDVVLEIGLLGLLLVSLYLLTIFWSILKTSPKNFSYGVLLGATFFFVLLNNLMESSLIRGFTPLWVALLLIGGLLAHKKDAFI